MLLHRPFLHNILMYSHQIGYSGSLEAWVYFLALLCYIKISASIKNTQFVTFLQIVEVLRHFVMLLTVTSIFNKGTPSSVC